MPHLQRDYTVSYWKSRRISILDASTRKSQWSAIQRTSFFSWQCCRVLQPIVLTLTCISSSLPWSFINTFQLSHPVLEGLHAALHAVSLLPVLAEGTDFFVQFFQFLCLTVYHSLYKTIRYELKQQRDIDLCKLNKDYISIIRYFANINKFHLRQIF